MNGTAPATPSAPLAPTRTRTALRIALAWTVGLGLLAWMTRGIDWPRLSAAIRPAPAWVWAAAVLGFAASYLLRALRMHAELSRRRPVAVRECLSLLLLHNAAVNVVPMRGGEAAYPLLVHRRLGIPVSDAIGSLVWMRVQDALVLAVLATALWPGLPPAVRAGGAAALVVGVLAAVALVQRAAGAAPAAARSRAGRLVGTALRALAEAPRHGVRGWVFCAGSWSVKLAAVGGLLAALSGHPLARGLAGALGGELAGVLPVQGPAGYGTYEAGVWAGASASSGVAGGSGRPLPVGPSPGRGPSPPGVGLEIAAAALAVHTASLATALAGGALAHALGGRSGRGEKP